MPPRRNPPAMIIPLLVDSNGGEEILDSLALAIDRITIGPDLQEGHAPAGEAPLDDHRAPEAVAALGLAVDEDSERPVRIDLERSGVENCRPGRHAVGRQFSTPDRSR